MASTAKSKHIMSPKRRMSLQRRRSRRRHRKYTESLDDSKSSISSDYPIYPPSSYYSSESEDVGPSNTSDSSSEVSEPSSTEEDSVPPEEPLWPRKRKKNPSLQEQPRSPSLPQWPAIPELEEQRKHSPKRPTELLYYGDIRCKCCRELAKLKLEHQPDDLEYVYPSDDNFFGDEELRLRVIHYRRERWMTGCFDVGCHPNFPSFGGTFHRDHFKGQNFDRMIGSCARSTIAEYCEKEKKELVFLRFLNATADIAGRVIFFFMTFECYNPLAEYYVDVCQAMVSFYLTHVDFNFRMVHLFRRVTNDDEDEDLLPTDKCRESYTKGRRPRRLDTWRDLQHQKGLF
ncbi:hypothetical protein LINGRAHAP2_LOCUS36535 [Linum grandiflorum]